MKKGGNGIKRTSTALPPTVRAVAIGGKFGVGNFIADGDRDAPAVASSFERHCCLVRALTSLFVAS